MNEGELVTATDLIRRFYRARATTECYATSPDFNLREIEIDYILRYLSDGQKVLDVGCGNGYSVARYASRFKSKFYGVDFVPEMASVARDVCAQFVLEGTVTFGAGDAAELPFTESTFDTVISQRCLLNLPSQDHQWRALSEIARVLKPGGRYLMLEGTLQGLRRLNHLRSIYGLRSIHEADPETNPFSNKFDEDELVATLNDCCFKVAEVQRFGMYFFLSRVVHPLFVFPDEPKYDAPINSIARRICLKIPDFQGLGHVALWVLRRE